MEESFADYRARLLGYLGRRDPSRRQWTASYGVHAVRGRQTVAEFVTLEAAHDLNHLRQIDRVAAAAGGGKRRKA